MNHGFRNFSNDVQEGLRGRIWTNGAERLLIDRHATNADILQVSAQNLLLPAEDGSAVIIGLEDVRVDYTITGIGGVDLTYGVASDTWLYLYAVSNGTRHGVVGTLDADQPLMQENFRYRRQIGCWRYTTSGWRQDRQFGDRVALGTRVLLGGAAIAPASTVAFNPISGTPLTDFQAAVPPIARAFWGTIRHASSSGTSQFCGQQVTTTTGYGHAQHSQSAARSGALYVPIVDHKFEWFADVGSANYEIYVAGYEL